MTGWTVLGLELGVRPCGVGVGFRLGLCALSYIIDVYMCVCVCVSGGCRLTVTGTNFNVSSTAEFHLSNDEFAIDESSTPVCHCVMTRL